MSESEEEPLGNSQDPLAPSNGLGLADTLAQNQPTGQSDFEINSSDEDGTGSSSGSSSVDELPATDREGHHAANRDDLFAKIYEMNRASKHDPAMDPPAQLVSSPSAPQSIHSTPEREPMGDPSSNVIDETPSEHPAAKVVDIWCKTQGSKWRPGYMLNELEDGMILARIAGDMEPITIEAANTRPLTLEIGETFKVLGHTGRHRVTDLIEDPHASFTTPDNVARLALLNHKRHSNVVGLDQIYWEQEPDPGTPRARKHAAASPATPVPHKRPAPDSPVQISTAPSPPETPSKLFARCKFLLTGINRDDEDQQMVKEIIVAHGGTVEQSVLHLVNPVTLEWEDDGDGDEGAGATEFGAVLTSTSIFTTKAVEAQVIGWPILSFTFIKACISAGELVDVENYLLKRPFKQCSPLRHQYMTRRLALGSVVPPVYLLAKSGESDNLALIMAICCNKKVQVVFSERDIPEGSLVVTERGEGEKTMHISVAHALSRQLLLEKTVYMSKTWLLQSIIDGRAV